MGTWVWIKVEENKKEKSKQEKDIPLEPKKESRRDFLYLSTISLGGIGGRRDNSKHIHEKAIKKWCTSKSYYI